MLSNQDIVIRLVAAAALGSLVGIEREHIEQPAGLRDHAMVALGSALIMIVSEYGFSPAAPNVVLDPSRVAAQVVSGIGFIGAGTIILRRNVVRGLTTAASIWAVAAVGLAAGGGLYVAATVATIIALGILAGMRPLERRFSARQRRTVLSVTVRRGAIGLAQIQELATARGLTIERFDVREGQTSAEDRVELVLFRPAPAQMTALLDILRAHPAVVSLRSTIRQNTGTIGGDRAESDHEGIP